MACEPAYSRRDPIRRCLDIDCAGNGLRYLTDQTMSDNVGPYRLSTPLGAGGMGEVFLAHDTRLDRQVAIKRVRAIDDTDAQRQILREARTVAHLSHPNIASVFDVVEQDGRLHVVMEYVEGETLAGRLRRGPLAEPEALSYGEQIAGALVYAHRQGIIHCDIKPSNVIVTPEGRVKVLDFGIARFEATIRDGEKTTFARVVRGTPAYMAPEVLHGAEPTAVSDVYSLGIVLFELVTARLPYAASLAAARLGGDAPSAPTPPLERPPELSRQLSEIVIRAIAPDPTMRFATAEELRRALEKLAERRRSSTRVPMFGSWRALIAVVVLAAVCLLLVAGLLTGVRIRTPSTQPPVLGVTIFNTTGDEGNDHFGAGATDLLIAQLSKAPGMTVVPRTALTPYLKRPEQWPVTVRELGLTHVLTGGVQRSADQVRVTINLMSGADRTLWTNTFDGSVADFFHLEQRMTDATLRALRSNGIVDRSTAADAVARLPTTNADAFETYARGRVLVERTDVPGNLDRALELFERAAMEDPHFVRAHAAIGEAAWLKYRESKDTSWIAHARASTLEALRLDPEDPSVRLSLAVIDHGTGRTDDAIANLEKLLQDQPARDDAHRFLGRIYSERRDFTRAIAEFREALRIRPEYPTTVRALGLALYDEGKLNDAIATFTTLTTLQPDNASAFQLLGTAYHAAGDLDRAFVAYERANALAPRAAAYSNIGIIHHTRRDYPRAIEAYRKAIALQPKEATTRRNLADALWASGNRQAARTEYRSAIDLAQDALKVNPKDARSHALVALCQAKLAEFGAAQDSLREALKLAPDDNEVVYKQAIIETMRGDLTAAMATLQRAIQLGYSKARLDADRDLDPLRALPGFPTLR
jgi:serine/threonine-protein kinase